MGTGTVLWIFAILGVGVALTAFADEDASTEDVPPEAPPSDNEDRNRVFGTDGRELFDTLEDDDAVFARKGNDTVQAADVDGLFVPRRGWRRYGQRRLRFVLFLVKNGDDDLRGEGVNSTLDGGLGDDFLLSTMEPDGAPANQLLGAEGEDTLIGTLLYGGEGDDDLSARGRVVFCRCRRGKRPDFWRSHGFGRKRAMTKFMTIYQDRLMPVLATTQCRSFLGSFLKVKLNWTWTSHWETGRMWSMSRSDHLSEAADVVTHEETTITDFDPRRRHFAL